MAYHRCTGTPGGSLKVRTAQGSIASFNTNLAALLRSVKCEINPVQSGSGTPYPAGGSVNKCNPDTFTRALINYPEGDTSSSSSWLTSDYIEVSQGSIAISGYADKSEKNFCVRFAQYDANKDTILVTANTDVSGAASWSHVITLQANTRYIRVTVGFDNKTTTIADYFSNNRLQIEEGSSATPYAPYSKVRPISGFSSLDLVRCGVNLVNFKLKPYLDAMPFWLPQGTYTCSLQTASGLVTAWYFGATKTDGTYCTKEELGVSDWNTGGDGAFFYGNANRDYFTFTIPSGVDEIKIGRLNADDTNGVMVNVGSTALPYAAYNGNTYAIDFDGTTCYGGTLNVTTGVLTCDYKKVKFSDLVNWQYRSGQFDCSITDGLNQETAGLPSFLLCDSYPVKDTGTSSAYPSDTCIWQGITANPVLIVRVRDANYTDTLTFLQNMGNAEIIYKLATPVQYQLTPEQVEALLGENNIYHNCNGDTEVKYLYNA